MRAKPISAWFILVIILITSIQDSALIKTIPRSTQAIDLRAPIYFILDPSFTAGCNDRLCSDERIKILKKGTDDWLQHFEKISRPKVVIFPPAYSISFKVFIYSPNSPIYVKIKDDGCVFDGAPCGAYFVTPPGYPEIIFRNPQTITIPTAAHEFGHALGLRHRDTYSIMNPRGKGNRVLPIDMETLCQLHEECPAYNSTWCEGSFKDKCRCPSESFEASEENKRVCK